MGSELIRTKAEFEDLYTSADRHMAYFRTRHFLSPSLIPSKHLLFTEHCFSDLPSISVVVWSKTGGAELVLLSSFDCYQLSNLIRRVGGAQRNLSVCEILRQLTQEFL
ncbi:Minichromosome maintenance family protein isoform 1 [Dorcoceras hygrometricum]|uniref:Minichromosome maintenance family protein isoform 1 n=1 Tax=Dorcoceras hygrometricum TaxID=472368 RepID=A0A2Z7CTN4_9LAMI|nr:Minichromosome maintenance family protein isoform 1 [Dorcoceras hygrometricum]